jgi:predicted aminopeptidase
VEPEYTGPVMTRQMALLAVLVTVLSGCSTLGYYAQAVHGQASILWSRQSVDRLLKDSSTPAGLRDQLHTARDILAFAQDELGLAAKGRFATYVATGRKAVVWNVVAAPELSLAPVTWCYPVVGCVPYRGYFREARARGFASRLSGAGMDVHVGAVPAYSTLGWFKDPLLDTFLDWPSGHLANLLFHELTHSRVWLPGDAVFNESLASFVGDAGARAWLMERVDARRQYVRDEGDEAAFRGALLGLRERLGRVYAGAGSDQQKRLQRAAELARFRACYLEHRALLGNGRFDAVVDHALNNALLAAWQTYDRYRDGFNALFVEAGGTWPEFWAAAEQLAELPAETRAAELTRLDATRAERHTAYENVDERSQEKRLQDDLWPESAPDDAGCGAALSRTMPAAVRRAVR